MSERLERWLEAYLGGQVLETSELGAGEGIATDPDDSNRPTGKVVLRRIQRGDGERRITLELPQPVLFGYRSVGLRMTDPEAKALAIAIARLVNDETP